jgi:hypothetical protein
MLEVPVVISSRLSCAWRAGASFKLRKVQKCLAQPRSPSTPCIQFKAHVVPFLFPVRMLSPAPPHCLRRPGTSIPGPACLSLCATQRAGCGRGLGGDLPQGLQVRPHEPPESPGLHGLPLLLLAACQVVASVVHVRIPRGGVEGAQEGGAEEGGGEGG